jgi:hypothetical protein
VEDWRRHLSLRSATLVLGSLCAVQEAVSRVIVQKATGHLARFHDRANNCRTPPFAAVAAIKLGWDPDTFLLVTITITHCCPGCACRSNRGAPGIDGQDFAAVEDYGLKQWLGELALALKEETYRPAPIRRVYIPKANGKLRPLGISTLRDRVATAGTEPCEVVVPLTGRSPPIILPYSFSSEEDGLHWIGSLKGSKRIEEACTFFE